MTREPMPCLSGTLSLRGKIGVGTYDVVSLEIFLEVSIGNINIVDKCFPLMIFQYLLNK